MWIIFIKIVPLCLLIKYIKCSSSLDPCQLYTGGGKDFELCLEVSVNGIKKQILHSTETSNDHTIIYDENDNVTLTCVILPPLIWEQTNAAYFQMEHKINGFMKNVLVTKHIKVNSHIKEYQIVFRPDRYDHGLHATCKVNGTETNTFVTFSSNHYNKIDEDITENSFTEGHSVPNTLNRTVIVYDNKSDWKIDKIIEPTTNIYDELTADKNGTIFSAWYDNPSQDIQLRTKIKRVLIKKFWKINVLSSDNAILDEISQKAFLTVEVTAGVVALLVIIVVAFWIFHKYVKRRQTNEDNNEHIYSEPSYVTYAEVALKASETSSPVVPQEPYAQIIGVLKKKKISAKTTS